MVAKKKVADPYTILGVRSKDGGLFASGSSNPLLAVGIDQSYSGFAITALSNETGEYYTWCYKSKGTGIDRLLDIEDWIVRVLYVLKDEGYSVTSTAIEGYAFGSQMANMLGELGCIVKRTLRTTGALSLDTARYPWIVAPTALKKYVSGKGNIKKNEVLLAVYKNYGVEFTDDNMADSFVLAHIAAGHSKYAYQADVLTKLVEADVKTGRYKNKEC